MKVLKLLRKEYPELELTLVLDEFNNTLTFSGNRTPPNLIGSWAITDLNINNVNVCISSIDSPEIRYNCTTNGNLRSLTLFIGGRITNNRSFIKIRNIIALDDLKQLFKPIELNKQIKIL